VSVSLQSVGAITLFIEDPPRSKAFYERVFELAAIYEDDEDRLTPPNSSPRARAARRASLASSASPPK
jgi:catechol 2,3-dioxygenase-like lactoylglutathione lyase family enzyme